MCGSIIEELCQRAHGGSGAFALLCGEGAECDEHGRVDSSGIVKECAQDFLYSFGVSGIERCGDVVRWGILGFGTVNWFLPSMRRMFWLTGCSMLEALKGTFNIPWHGDLTGAGFVIPIEVESAIAFGIPVGAANVQFFKGGESVISIIFFGVLDCDICDN